MKLQHYRILSGVIFTVMQATVVASRCVHITVSGFYHACQCTLVPLYKTLSFFPTVERAHTDSDINITEYPSASLL